MPINLPPTPPLGPEGFAASTWQRWLDILRKRLQEAYAPGNPPPQEFGAPASAAAVAVVRESLLQLELAVVSMADSGPAVAALRQLAALLGADANFAALSTTGNATFGNASQLTLAIVNGTAAGAGGGAYAEVQNAGTPIITWGNTSAVLGGAYSALPIVSYAGTLLFTAAIQVTAGFGCNTKAPQAAVASGGAVAVTGSTNIAPYGYTTAAQADDIITKLNTMQAALIANGILS